VISTVTTIRDLRTTLLGWREAGETVALVPTMGALHQGHKVLVETAGKMAKRAVTSIFLNPLQFGPKEDLAKYPRSLEADQKLLSEAGCDLLYAPTPADMYPPDFAAKIDPGPLGTILEGAARPGHFTGVVTVVIKLLLQTMPDIALFGEKDYQQLLIIHRAVRDLDLPIHIVGVPIVRDTDGLAFSSRNVYLSPDERKCAVALPNTLQETAATIREGKDIAAALKTGQDKLTKAGFTVDYLELADAHTLAPTRTLTGPARLLAAAKIGATRLIDNLAVAG